MSAMHHEDRYRDGEVSPPEATDEAVLAPSPVVVRRNAGIAALIGGAACAIAIAYLWRAIGSGAPLDWLLCLTMAGVGGYHLSTLLDARTPLVVADELGVRIRLGRQWRGLPWDAVASVEVEPRRGALRDGRLVFRPYSLERALENLEPGSRRAARLNQKMYGGALAVPIGLTTRAAADPSDLVAGLEALSAGRTGVVLLEPEPDPAVEPEAAPVLQEEASPEPAPVGLDPAPVGLDPALVGLEAAPVDLERAPVDVEAAPVGPAIDATGEPADPETEPPARRRRTFVGGLGTIVSRVAKGRSHDTDADADTCIDADADTDVDADAETGTGTGAEQAPQARPAAHAPALRIARKGARAEVSRDLPATGGLLSGATALHPDGSAADAPSGLPEGRELRRAGSVDLVFEPPVSSTVRPISRLGTAVEPLVIDDFVTEPAYDPVIGPDLAAARTRLGLTVDELADRTRIRPHVIESIEVDDFTPCGGDFYARGHLRTLARVLGQDPDPLLERFDDRYATAPINASRVFEAELATGMTGSMRRTVGGPNWGLLVGAVLVLLMAWGVIRLFETEPPALVQAPTAVLNGSAGLPQEREAAQQRRAAAAPVPVALVADQDVSGVLVRDADGTVVWAGRLGQGERKTLSAAFPMTVRADDAGAVRVLVRGEQRGVLGEAGSPARRTFTRADPR